RAAIPRRRRPRRPRGDPGRGAATRRRSLPVRRSRCRARPGRRHRANRRRGGRRRSALMTSIALTRRISRMALRTLALVFVAALPLGPTPGLAQDTLKIGFFAPLTGFAAADGASAKHSAEIAVEELNAAGGLKGKKVELIVYDDRHDSKEA